MNKMANKNILTAELVLVLQFCNVSIFVLIQVFKCALCPLDMD